MPENTPQTVQTNPPRRGLGRMDIAAILLLCYDIIAVNLSYLIALWLRFDCRYSMIPKAYLYAWLKFAPIYIVVCVAAHWFAKLYRSIWRFASLPELTRAVIATVITGLVHALGITILFQRMPVAYYLIGAVIQLLATIASRFGYRFVLLIQSANKIDAKGRNRVMLIGAGSAGQMIMQDVRRATEITDQVVCIIDDDPNKWKHYIDGVPIVGGRDDILANVEKYRINKIFFAIPSSTAAQRRDILNICSQTGCELKQLPGMYQFMLGDISVTAMKDVSVEDLLGREPISADMDEVFDDLDQFIIDNDYDVCSFGYDPYNAKHFVERWEAENGPYGMEVVRQGVKTESVPLGELKKLAEDRMLIFDQEIMMFTMGNAIVMKDNNNNKKLMKRKPEQKIDNVSAMMDALVAYKVHKDIFE